MRKLTMLLSIFLFLSFNTSTAFSVADTKTFSQGFYTMNDLGLSEKAPYTIQNTSPNNSALVLVVDENQKIQQILRLPPAPSNKYNLTPLINSFHFIIYGDDVKVIFS